MKVQLPVTITLEHEDVLTAALAGARRMALIIEAGRSQTYGAEKRNQDRWAMHIEGAGYELAAAKVLNVHWDAVRNRPGGHDIGMNTQVRGSTRSDASLIVHEDDPDHAYYFLVTGELPTLTVHGYARGYEAKDIVFWREDVPHPAFFVPQIGLNTLF